MGRRRFLADINLITDNLAVFVPAAVRLEFQSSQKLIDNLKRTVFEINSRQPALGRISKHFGMCHAKFLAVAKPKIKGGERARGMNLM